MILPARRKADMGGVGTIPSILPLVPLLVGKGPANSGRGGDESLLREG